MRLFNIDLHISVIADIKNIFNTIRPDIEIINWSLSGHTWIFNKTPDEVKIITSESWHQISINLIEKFHDEYDDFLKGFDGFIVCHPNVFILLFEKYNKPIIVINSCRYDMPFCWNKDFTMITELQERLKILQAKNLLILISNNLADNTYFKLANPDINIQIVPSLCLYTEMKWDPLKTNGRFLVYTGEIPEHRLIEKRAQSYPWSYLMNFEGIIHIPYEVSTMSIFEQISSGIPLFFPTKEFLKELWLKGQKKYMNYWGDPPSYLVKTKTDDFWLDRADYYLIEGAYYYNSFSELFTILENFSDYKYDQRISYNTLRKKTVIKTYEQILSKM